MLDVAGLAGISLSRPWRQGWQEISVEKRERKSMKECKAVKINQIMKTPSAIWAENWKQKKTDEVHIF